MRKWILRIAALLVAVVAGSVLAGALLPREHVATSAVRLRQAPESVWAVVRDLGGVPSWWAEIESSEPVADAVGHEAWRQRMSGFSMTLLITESTAPRRLVTAIDAPPDAAFGGTWTYELTPADGGTRIAVTEAGWIGNPLYRVMAHLGGMHRSLDGYLVALGARFGERVTPEHVSR
jgi:uncharacterized protein YndB with AHSA1/START domain